MDMKQSFIALTIALTSTSALAYPVITATQGKNGAWITITNDGVPVPFAVVNDDYITNENGRVFVYNQRENSRTINYIAVTPDGDEIETRMYYFDTGRNIY